MDRVESYIKELLYERGINEHDKKDLEFEIKDHLMLLKNEYLDKGLSEKDAIELSIKDFGESNSIGNDIKNNLPSHNKYIDFMFRERAQCLLYMFLLYFLFIFSCATFLNKNFTSLFFYIGTAMVVILTSFIFVNKKVNNDKNKVKNIIRINIQFFIIEKIVMSLFFLTAVTIRGGANIPPLINFYIFNWIYIVGFILLTLSSVIITKYTVTKVFDNIKNNYNTTIITTILFSISILFIIIYYLIPNRFYVLRKIIISMLGSDITNVTRHLFFIVINNSFIIPNIGLIILIILCIRLVIRIKKKGIQSIL